MVLDLSIRKRKHPEFPDYPTPEQTPKEEDSPTMYSRRYQNSLTEFLENPNSSEFFTISSEKLKTFQAFPKEPLSTTCGLDMDNDKLTATESSTSYSQTRWVHSQVYANTDGNNVIMRRNQIQSLEIENTSAQPRLETWPFTPLPKYPIHLSSTAYYTQFKDEVSPQVPLGYRNKTNGNLKKNQHQSLKHEDTSYLETDEENNEATDRSIDIRSAYCSSECSENFNPSDSSTSSFPETKTRPFKAHPKYPFYQISGLDSNKEKLLINSTTFHTQFRDEVHSQEEISSNMSYENMGRIQIKNEYSSYLENNKKTNERIKKSLEVSSDCSTEYSKSGNVSEISIPSFPKLKTRPFKAFSEDLISGLVMNNEELLPNVSNTSYTQFRDRILSQANHKVSNENMRRNQVNTSDIRDPSYLEKRKKNNEAAKKSRDARKAKEDEIAIRCAYLEHENKELRNRLSILDSYVSELGICFRYS